MKKNIIPFFIFMYLANVVFFSIIAFLCFVFGERVIAPTYKDFLILQVNIGILCSLALFHINKKDKEVSGE